MEGTKKVFSKARVVSAYIEIGHWMSYDFYMNKYHVFARALMAIAVLILMSGCFQIHRVDTFEPVYLSYDEFRKTVITEEPRTITQTGKIYTKDSYLFINEYHEGVHVIDNSDPSNPVPVTFIPILGNVDIAIQGTILYADSFIDLVAIDISNPALPVEVDRVESIFPYNTQQPWFEDGFRWGDILEPVDEDLGIVIGWNKTDTRVELRRTDLLYAVDLAGTAETGSGTGGSMARFTIVSNYLYALHTGYIQLFDISVPEDPAVWSKIQLAWDIETIFPYQDKLFIGSQTGMYIFDNTDPAYPQQLSEFTHATSCDPVVATSTRAYVTLRSGRGCGGMSDQLDIIDITDLMSPVLIKSFGMQGPYGLGIDGATLFLCDGIAGLKVYDVSNDTSIDLLHHVPDIEVFDVIAGQGLAIVIGPGGLRQYDYTDLNDISLLSTIAVGG
ncbi:MAG: hypothetical protein HN368_07310 [Spirochaetales bacterium]|nr:hypothetical protein [Spirochaetales bacterium]